MKKIIILLFATALIITGISCQDVSHEFTMRSNKTMFGQTDEGANIAIATDTLGSVDQDTIDFIIVTNKNNPYQYRIPMNLDSTSGTPTVSIVLAGRDWDDESWNTISTVNWAGSSSDTTFAFSAQSDVSLTFVNTVVDTGTFAYDTTSLFPSTQTTLNDSSTLWTGVAYNASTQTGTLSYTEGDLYYRKLRIRFIITAGTATIDWLRPKIWLKQN